MGGPQPARRRGGRDEIEYAIVALDLSAMEIARIVKEATGLTIDAKAADFLRALDESQLEATWKRLSENRGWRRATDRFY
jgi:hypothetical protein